jgi:hypothetical protein
MAPERLPTLVAGAAEEEEAEMVGTFIATGIVDEAAYSCATDLLVGKTCVGCNELNDAEADTVRGRPGSGGG